MMELYGIFVKAHGGFAMLLELLALSCFLIAAFTQIKGANAAWLAKAKLFTLCQSIVGGLLAITGFVVMFWGSWGYQHVWLWAGVVLVIAYPLLSVRVTKPALAATIEGGSSGKWLVMTGVHLLLLLLVHALMMLKST